MGDTLVPNPVSLGLRALTFGLNNIENARGNLPGFPAGTEPTPDQRNLAQEGGGGGQMSLMGSYAPSIYSQATQGRGGRGAGGKAAPGGGKR